MAINRTLSSNLNLGVLARRNEAVSRKVNAIGKSVPRKRLVRFGLIAGNLLLLSAVIAFIVSTPRSSASTQTANSAPAGTINPLDQLASASIALTAARMASLPETTPISNQADSELALLTVAPATNSVSAKPEVVATDYVSNKDIKTYVVKPGDTVGSIAQQFNISSNSIIWSNNLRDNNVSVGDKLLIPPISGIIYTVKSGDTPTSLAQKYSASSSQIIAYNDAEISGIHPGERIIIPNGIVPSAAPVSLASYGWGGQAQYGYNGYDFGYCTYWVAYLRQKAGHPVPTNLGDASTWAIRAQEFGLPVGTTPRAGAAVVLSTYGAGHVAYVEAVNSDGSITISEMNHEGWDVVDTRTIPSGGYEYVY